MRNLETTSNDELITLVAGKKIVEYDNLLQLAQMSCEEMMQIKGIGRATAKKIQAAFELGRRVLIEESYKDKLEIANDVYNFMSPRLKGLDHEEVYAIAMDNVFHVKAVKCMSSGGLTETAVDVRQILAFALSNKATVLVLCHNHPSGKQSPSKEDNRITENLHKACEVMRIHLLDHVIIAGASYYSYRECGRI